MDCRFCDEPSEREDCYQTSGARGIVNLAATYACNTCGRSYWWEKGVPGLAPLFAPEDFPSPYTLWEDAS